MGTHERTRLPACLPPMQKNLLEIQPVTSGGARVFFSSFKTSRGGDKDGWPGLLPFERG